MKEIRTVAIVGGGPAGSALGTLLSRRGIKVVIFTHEKRPELVIGESLVPAVVPLLRELGVEREVSSYSTFKPGATFSMRAGEEITFVFSNARRPAATYAYNTPRDRFDQTLLDEARRSGVSVLLHAVKLQKRDEGAVCLDQQSEAEYQKIVGAPPDLIVDASGRSRAIAKLLELPFREGARKDRALFAHLADTAISYPGHIHVDRLSRGWSWRIPLPGRVSVGLVVPEEHADAHGTSAEEQFDALIRSETVAKRYAPNPNRITAVMKYSNYQLVSEKMYGPGWVLLGDAAGFIDPIFSSGMLVGLTSAKRLAEDIFSAKGSFHAYQSAVQRQLRSWHNVVNYFYDGRLFGLIRAGRALRGTFPARYFAPYLESHLGRILTGTAPDDPYSQGLMSLAMRLIVGEGTHLRLRVA